MPPEPTPQTTPPTPPAGATPDTGTGDSDWKAEAEKWKGLSRKHEAQAKENLAAAQKLAAYEESQKSESQKAADRMAVLEREVSEAKTTALRYEVGVEKGVPTKLLRYLSGSTKEELEANAAQLIADFGTGTDPSKGAGAQSGRPREALRPGAAPGANPDPNAEINSRIREAIRR
jgi:hypothetical protein